MFQRESWAYVYDSTNIRWIKIFHLYKGFFRKITKVGFFVKGSARVVEPPRVEYKGFKYRYNIKGDIARMWLAKSQLQNYYTDGSISNLVGSGGFIVKKRQDPKSKFLRGPISRSINRKKFKTLFKTLI